MAQASSIGHLKLYSNPICPFAHRAWWTIKEKQQPHEFIHIPLGPEKPEWYVKDINPRGTVPTLRVDDKSVFESSIIAEFLDDAFPEAGTRLLPADPFKRANIRLFLDQLGGAIPPLYGLLRNQDRQKDEELKNNVKAKLDPLLAFVKEVNADGPFFLGSEFSLADIAFVPFLDRFRVTLPYYRDYDLFADYPRLKQWYDAALERPAFRETAQEASYYIQNYASYGGTPTTPK